MINPTNAISNSANLPQNNLDNQEFIRVLSDYFSYRGRFLAQIISADIRNFHNPYNQNIQSSLKTNNLSFDNSNIQIKNSLENNNLSDDNGHQINSLKTNNISFDDDNLKEEKAMGLNSSSNETELLKSSEPVIPEPTIGIDVEALLIDLVVEQTGYSKESIGLDAKLLEDLSLDSIKAGELIATAAKECGVAGDIDPSSLANADLIEIANAIRSAMPAEPHTETTHSLASKNAASTPDFSALGNQNPQEILSKLEHLSAAEVDSLLASSLS